MQIVRTLRAELGADHTHAVKWVATELGYGVESVRQWVRQTDIDDGHAVGVSSSDSARYVRDVELRPVLRRLWKAAGRDRNRS